VTDALHPFCDACGTSKGIAVARVTPASDGFHDVEEYLLECGHVVEPDARIGDGVVQLLQLHRPDTIEVLDLEGVE
jgi:hypothetical protein